MQTLDFVSGLHKIMSRILLLVFISGYANTENVFYCLNKTHRIILTLIAREAKVIAIAASKN